MFYRQEHHAGKRRGSSSVVCDAYVDTGVGNFAVDVAAAELRLGVGDCSSYDPRKASYGSFAGCD